ncbi:phenylalanine--tRNA ligase subunit alpha [Halorutilales archaeon Cl-col2-1]
METDLTDSQTKVLEAVSEAESEAEETTATVTVDDLADETGLGRGPVEQAVFDLQELGLVEVDEETEVRYELTDEGEEYAENELPERRLHSYLVENDGAEMSELQEIDGFNVGIGHLRSKGWAEIEDGFVEPKDAPESDDERGLETLSSGGEIDEEMGEELERRGLVSDKTVRTVTVGLTREGEEALSMSEVDSGAEKVGELTHEMLATGDWRDREFASYNVEAEPPEEFGGREHILRQLANRVKEVLTSMGFKEMEGPHVDSEFYINDCLFMPQDHPARTHWDKFNIEDPSHANDLPEFADDVERMHHEGAEGGEGYHSDWERDVARRLNLRGHTTSLTVRYLAQDLEPPQRFFSVDKVYRNDTLDPTHLLEFYQIEGWVMARDLSVRDLMGTFEEFYNRFGIEEIEFKPHYNPYTEPSFEIFGEHPETGDLIEIGNSGMFRREILEPHGIDDDVEVIAWGLALERLLMLIYGFEDIRDVHGTLADLELLREVPVLWQ